MLKQLCQWIQISKMQTNRIKNNKKVKNKHKFKMKSMENNNEVNIQFTYFVYFIYIR